MKTTINFYQFTEAFRESRPNSFNYEALEALFDYFEQYEADTGVEVELDVIAICEDFNEYDYEYVATEYNIPYTNDKELKDKVIEYLENNTFIVAHFDDTVLFEAF